jgi:large subunit ribosomal protein L17
MRHNLSGRSFSRPTSHRIMMYRNLVTDLLRYEKIVTTEANDKQITDKLFKEIAPKYAQRSGGYTRIVKLGQRVGDAAPIAQLELVK